MRVAFFEKAEKQKEAALPLHRLVFTKGFGGSDAPHPEGSSHTSTFRGKVTGSSCFWRIGAYTSTTFRGKSLVGGCGQTSVF